jgi:hypothetical protein
MMEMSLRIAASRRPQGESERSSSVRKPRGIVNAFEQRSERAACLELDAQLADHAFDLAQHDGDRLGKRRFGDTRRLIAFRGACCEADKLPGERQPAHHQDQPAKENIRLACEMVWRLLRCRSFDQGLHLVDLFALESAQVPWQPPREVAKHVAQREDAQQHADILERARRADLHDAGASFRRPRLRRWFP